MSGEAVAYKDIREGWQAIFGFIGFIAGLVFANFIWTEPENEKSGFLFSIVLLILLLGSVLWGIILGSWLGLIPAGIHICILKSGDRLKDALQNAKMRQKLRQKQRIEEQQRKSFQRQDQKMKRENEAKDNTENLIHAKTTLIKSLGNVDSFIRVFRSASDGFTKTSALQDAQTEMTRIVAMMASGEIPLKAINDSHVRDQAKATSKDMAEAGLGNDRLNRDLIRIFKLKSLW